MNLSNNAKEALAVLQDKKVLTGCTSYVQRRLQIGYGRAANLLEELETAGILSEPDSQGSRHWLTMTTPGEEIASLAWSAFRAWCRDHDADGNLSPLEQVEAYRRWCDGPAERLCQKCRVPTKGEEAYVDGQYWCHPCADSLDQRPRS